MKTYLLQAPRDFTDAGIPKGFMIQVISSRTGSTPDVSEVKEALHRCRIYRLRRQLGFTRKLDSKGT